MQGAIATGDGVAIIPAAADGVPLGPGGGGDDGDDGGDDDPNRIRKIGDLMRGRGNSAPLPAWKKQKRDTQRYLQQVFAPPEQAAAEEVMRLVMAAMDRTLGGLGRQGAAFPAVLDDAWMMPTGPWEARQLETPDAPDFDVIDITDHVDDPVPIRPTAAPSSKSAPPAKAAPPPLTRRLPIPHRPPPPWKAPAGAPAEPRRPWMRPPPGMPPMMPPPPPAMEPPPSFPPPLPTIPQHHGDDWEAWTGRCFFFNNMWLLAIQALPIHEELLIESGSLVA